MIRFLFFCVIILSFFSRCSVSNSNIYSYDANVGIMMHPEFKVYHYEETNSKLYFKLSTNEILYTRNNRNQPFQANIILKYSVVYGNNKQEIDSGTLYITDKYEDDKNDFLDTAFNFSFQMNNIGSIKLDLFDVNRSRNANETLSIDKKNQSNEQFFSFKDSSGKFILENHFHKGQLIYISSDFHQRKNIFALKNNTKFPLPSPPFSKSSTLTFPKKTGYAESYKFNQENAIEYKLPKSGFVYFQLDTTSNDGFTIFNFHQKYPLIKDVENLIPPLRYLSTREEYDLLTADNNPKNAVDRFWLSKTNSNERARTLIRNFYSRVQLANEVFTSHLEGWKTDRGLVSIIFGSPNYVRNNKNYETWIYGSDHNSNTIKFTFEKMENPFSSNDYVLKRSYAYKTPWYIAVESWRSGKVYWLQ